MRIVKTSSSILRKFLIFNFFAFLILGLFTFIYLKGIQPNLVKQRTEKHVVIIEDNITFFILMSKKVKKMNAEMKPGRYKIKTIPRYAGKQSFP